ncbi:ATP-binding protein [soil metagenome]
MAKNPFSPTFGTSPSVLVGRDEVLDTIRDSFDDGAHSPARTVLFTGARGVGKTVMLNELEDHARRLGWLVISEVASAGLLDRLTRSHLPQLLTDHDPRSSTKLSSAEISTPVGGVQAQWQDRYPVESTLRTQISDLTDLLRIHETGLLLTVDEIQSADPEDLRKLGEVLQLARREGRDLAFGGAGLSRAVTDLLNDDVVTFLRRAERFDLAEVPIDQVGAAMGTAIRDQHREITPENLDRAAQATHGYPFLIQLVGHRIWLQHPQSNEITSDDVTAGIEQATRRLGSLVHEPAMTELSEIDRAYLVAMAIDGDGPSRTGQVAARLHVEAQYAGVYRDRLIGHGIIEPAGHGLVRFTIPYLGQHLAEHGATDALKRITRSTRRRAAPSIDPPTVD